MTIDLQRGRFLRVADGAGSISDTHNSPPEGNRIMKSLLLAFSLAVVALSGCAQLENQAYGGASATEEQSPFPKSSSNIAGN